MIILNTSLSIEPTKPTFTDFIKDVTNNESVKMDYSFKELTMDELLKQSEDALLADYDCVVQKTAQSDQFEGDNKYSQYNADGIIIIDGDIDEKMVSSFNVQYQTAWDECDDLKIIIRSLGGLSECAVFIANTLYFHHGKTTCYIHGYAYSCGTVIALHCNEIISKKHSKISPIDHMVTLKKKGDKPGEHCIKRESGIIVLLKLLKDSYGDKSLNNLFRNLAFEFRNDAVTLEKIFNKHNIEHKFEKLLFVRLLNNPNIPHKTSYKACYVNEYFGRDLINIKQTYDFDVVNAISYFM